MIDIGIVILLVACGGHIAADAAIFLVPVGAILATIWMLNRWGPKDPEDNLTD